MWTWYETFGHGYTVIFVPGDIFPGAGWRYKGKFPNLKTKEEAESLAQYFNNAMKTPPVNYGKVYETWRLMKVIFPEKT